MSVIKIGNRSETLQSLVKMQNFTLTIRLSEMLDVFRRLHGTEAARNTGLHSRCDE